MGGVLDLVFAVLAMVAFFMAGLVVGQADEQRRQLKNVIKYKDLTPAEQDAVWKYVAASFGRRP